MSVGRFGSDNLITLTDQSKREEVERRWSPKKKAGRTSLASLVTHQPGETAIAEGSRTGQLLILRKGAIAIVKMHTEIATVAEPGAALA